MKLRYYLYIIMLALAAALTACGEKSHTDEPDPEVPSDPVDRTVLVYMVADNSLGAYGNDASDLKEMTQAAAAGDLNGGRLVVYHNRRGTAAGNAPQLVEITAEGEKVLKTYPDDPDIYSVDAERMAEVIADVKRIAPAGDYGLILWSHANGWMETSSSRSFGQDRTATMKISSLARALEGNEFSFIYFDCCSMASVEVMWELKDYARVMAASGMELPADGMPYHLTLKSFFASGEADVVEAARTTYNYYDVMTGWRRTCTMTVVDTQALDALARASQDVFAGVTEFSSSLADVQPYYRDAIVTYMYDFEHYVELLKPVASKLAAWRAALDDAIIFAQATPTLFDELNIDRYCGLGCYVIRDKRDIGMFNYEERLWYTQVVSCSPLLSINF